VLGAVVFVPSLLPFRMALPSRHDGVQAYAS
jgi:hypothetical protein